MTADLKAYEVWATTPEAEGTLADRARGVLPEMESTKQLVKLVSGMYKPGMTVLDVGCNAGHYLRGLHRLDPTLAYTGIDAYPSYIEQALEIFADDPNAQFAVKSILDPLYPNDPRDISYCCNVLLHLPDFRVPVRNILASTTQVCFIRSLFGEYTTIVRRARDHELDKHGDPVRFIFQNTWEESLFTTFVESLGWKVEFIEDEFDPKVLESEYGELKKGRGTRIVGAKQVDGNIVFNWVWAKITPR